MGSLTPTRIAAKAIHDARCGPPVIHRSPKRYEDCIDFYEDHAQLALDGLAEAGYSIERRP